MSETKQEIPLLSGPMVAPPSGQPQQIVVLLHGYGSDGNDLIGLANYWRQQMPEALFIAPNAPHACDINPSGYQWFPLDLDRELSRLSGAESARPIVFKFLEALWQETGLGPEQTLLVGFSQGAMMAMDVGLRLDKELIGIVAFSGALIGPEELASSIKAKPSVCLVHGTADEVVPVSSSKQAVVHLDNLGVKTALHLDEGSGHTISMDGLGFAVAFLREIVARRDGDAKKG